MAGLGPAWQGAAGLGKAGEARQGEAWRGAAGQGKAGMAWRGRARQERHGMARHGMARRGRRGVARQGRRGGTMNANSNQIRRLSGGEMIPLAIRIYLTAVMAVAIAAVIYALVA
jgi:hypothetical protein